MAAARIFECHLGHDHERRCGRDVSVVDRVPDTDHAPDGMEVLKKMFTPEFRNRLDAIIPFGPLSREVIRRWWISS